MTGREGIVNQAINRKKTEKLIDILINGREKKLKLIHRVEDEVGKS
jgi:hypothetical protein